MSEKPVRAVKLNVINEPKDSYTGATLLHFVLVVDTIKFPA